MPDLLTVDTKQAERFLTALAAGAPDAVFAFQVYDDKKNGGPAWHKTGTFKDHCAELIEANSQGCGVFVTVNRTDGGGRKAENIIGIRGVFTDLDGAPIDPVKTFPLKPHIVVESSPRRFHAYWLTAAFPAEKFTQVQCAIAAKFGGDPSVKDLPRVMRIPGFWHQKGEPFLSMFVESNHHAPFGPAEIIAAFPTTSKAPVGPTGAIENENAENHATSITDLLASGAPNGQRNNGLTRVAGLLRSHGLTSGIIGELLAAVNEARSIGLPGAEVAGIARSIGRYAPAPEHRQLEASHILTVDGLRDAWRKERAAHGKPINFGFPIMTTTVKRFLPGEVLTIAGRSGTGKTSLLVHLARAVADSLDGKGLFVSLEMSAPSLYHRMSTIAGDTDEWEAVNEDELHGKVRQRFGNLLTVDRDSLTLLQIEQYLTLAREGFGAVPVVAIDYLGYLRDAASGSQYEKVSRIAREVKALAKRSESRIILGCQTSRAGEAGAVPVQLHHLRDSGAIEESADIIVGLWSDSDDPARRHCSILKNRHGRQDIRFDLANSNLNFTEIPVMEGREKF